MDSMSVTIDPDVPSPCKPRPRSVPEIQARAVDPRVRRRKPRNSQETLVRLYPENAYDDDFKDTDDWEMEHFPSAAAEKLKEYHSILYYFFCMFSIIVIIIIVAMLKTDVIDPRFSTHSTFIAVFVFPAYVMCSVLMYLTRKNFILNNMTTHIFSVVFGFTLGFVTFVMFGNLIRTLDYSAKDSNMAKSSM